MCYDVKNKILADC